MDTTNDKPIPIGTTGLRIDRKKLRSGVNSATQVLVVAANEKLPENPATEAPAAPKPRKARR